MAGGAGVFLFAEFVCGSALSNVCGGMGGAGGAEFAAAADIAEVSEAVEAEAEGEILGLTVSTVDGLLLSGDFAALPMLIETT